LTNLDSARWGSIATKAEAFTDFDMAGFDADGRTSAPGTIRCKSLQMRHL
jgi:hypothetical protein